MPGRISWTLFVWLIVLLIGGLGADQLAMAQGRLNDNDLQQLMENLKNDTQHFRQSFTEALKKSTIRKTSQEKDAGALANTFVKQANGTLEIFKHHKRADQAVASLVNTAAQIDPLVYSLQPGTQTTSRWEKVRSELHQVAQAYGIPEPYLAPQQGNTAEVSTTGTCLNAVGIERSRQLVNECLQVSPATHPPCNAQNACSLIVGEIERGCSLIGQGAPGFCAEYR